MFRRKSLLLLGCWFFSLGIGLLLLDFANDYFVREYRFSDKNPAKEYIQKLGKESLTIEQQNAVIKATSVAKGIDDFFLRIKIGFSFVLLTVFLGIFTFARRR